MYKNNYPLAKQKDAFNGIPIKSKYDSKCTFCGVPIIIGEKVYYYPHNPTGKKIGCEKCWNGIQAKKKVKIV